VFDNVKGVEVKPEDYLLPPEYGELIGNRQVSKEELPPPLPEVSQEQVELPPPRPVVPGSQRAARRRDPDRCR